MSTSVRETATVLEPVERARPSLARAGFGFLVSAALLVVIMVCVATLQGAP
jgi:hypothetical protein